MIHCRLQSLDTVAVWEYERIAPQQKRGEPANLEVLHGYRC